MIILVATLPFFPNSYEEMYSKSIIPVCITLWVILGILFFAYLKSSNWISWKRGFEFPRLLVFYDNNIESYRFWGLKRENVFPSKIKVNGDIENLNPEANIEDKSRSKVELLTSEGNHIAYLDSRSCILQNQNLVYQFIKDQ